MDAWRQRALDAASQLNEQVTPYVENSQSAMVSMQQSQSKYIASMREGWEGETANHPNFSTGTHLDSLQLRFLLLHLLNVSKNEEANKMSVDNFALVFSPSLSIQGDHISASNTYDAATPTHIARKLAPPPPPPSKRTPSQKSHISNIMSNGSPSSFSKSSQPPSSSSFGEVHP
ncbi:hypothetical protein BJ741DRAFT_709573 [Chytriomyces cf. hyalinus JEL632]|nr:hypothetical protein BJ741DRAFT_709573 [Chytriomyces cf. hyalinus JEL632]